MKNKDPVSFCVNVFDGYQFFCFEFTEKICERSNMRIVCDVDETDSPADTVLFVTSTSSDIEDCEEVNMIIPLLALSMYEPLVNLCVFV